MNASKLTIKPINPNALNPGGTVYALYKIYPSVRWFLGYYRSEEDYTIYLDWLTKHETDPEQYNISYEAKEVSDYGIPQPKIHDIKHDREVAAKEKMLGRLRRKFKKRHPTQHEIEYRKFLRQERRRAKRYWSRGEEAPPLPLNRRYFPKLFDMSCIQPPTTTPGGIKFALRYLYK